MRYSGYSFRSTRHLKKAELVELLDAMVFKLPLELTRTATEGKDLATRIQITAAGAAPRSSRNTVPERHLFKMQGVQIIIGAHCPQWRLIRSRKQQMTTLWKTTQISKLKAGSQCSGRGHCPLVALLRRARVFRSTRRVQVAV